jgi:hypothetical protein
MLRMISERCGTGSHRCAVALAGGRGRPCTAQMPKTALPRALQLVDSGLVTRASLVAGGVHDDLADRLVRQRLWRRLAPSVFLSSDLPPTDPQLVSAARLHAGDDVVVTGAVACRALDMPYAPQEPVVEVIIPSGTRVVSTPYIVVHQSDRQTPTWVRAGVRHAMPLRAVVDAGRRLDDLRTVRALLLGAVCRGFCSAAELAAEVEAGPQRGSGLVRRAADDALAGAWSAPEAEAADLVGRAVRAGRLPPFLLNPTLHVSGRRVGMPDGWVVGTGVGWQVDSREFHAEEDDFDATLAVHDGFAEHGLTLLHVTPRRLRRLGPAWVELLVGAVAARPPGSAEPPGLVVRASGALQTGRTARRPLPARVTR